MDQRETTMDMDRVTNQEPNGNTESVGAPMEYQNNQRGQGNDQQRQGVDPQRQGVDPQRQGNDQPGQAILEIQGLKKSFGNVEVLKDINLTVNRNEVLALIGPSGSGKSTLLRCLNLLEEPTGGDILFHGDSILADRFNTREYRAKVGMVFQQFNLFNNLSVLENCILGQEKVLGRSRAEAEQKALAVLKQVGMERYVNAMPAQISGGQKQRVGIARALAMDPEVLLFDEPTSALDPEMVGEVLNVMQSLAAENMTMVVVTHEMRFAQNVATKVCFMQDGIIEEMGTPTEVFTAPTSAKTQAFVQSYVNR